MDSLNQLPSGPGSTELQLLGCLVVGAGPEVFGEWWPAIWHVVLISHN